MRRRRTAAGAASVEHTKIYEAIVRRDTDAAGAAMAEHLDAAEQSFALLAETLNGAPSQSIQAKQR